MLLHKEADEKTFEVLQWPRKQTKAEIAKAVAQRGRPPKLNRKQSTTLRLDPEVIEHFRKDGPGWQTRMGEVYAARSSDRRQNDAGHDHAADRG